MSNLGHAAVLTIFPVAAAATGAGVALVRRPSGAVMSGVQHFAAGVVIAALVGEILPDLKESARWGWAVVGFAAGVAVVLLLGEWGRRLDRRPTTTARTGALPAGMLAAVGIDLLIDGALVGLGTTLSTTQALILTAALTIEILFLALSVQGELVDKGVAARQAALISGGLGLLTAVGALAASLALTSAGAGPTAAMLAFGTAALLYLAVEELLVEAHEENETAWMSGMFFLGFVIIYALAQAGG